MNQDAPRPSRESRIRLISIKTKLGEWCISTDPETFAISHVTYGSPYYLTNSVFPDFDRVTTEDLYEHVRAVAEHRTGLPEWDSSHEKVSDYVLDWKAEFDNRLRMRVLGEYLTRRPNGSLRSLDDYFHFKHSYLIDRIEMKELLTELITTGQIDKLPSLDMAPAELKSLQRLAKAWLEDKPEE